MNNTDIASLEQGTAPTPKCSQCPPGQLKTLPRSSKPKFSEKGVFRNTSYQLVTPIDLAGLESYEFSQKCLGPHGPRFSDKNPLKQWSPIFLESGTSFVADNFSMYGVGVVWDDPRAVYSLCTLFLLSLHQLHLRSSGPRARRLGTPALKKDTQDSSTLLGGLQLSLLHYPFLSPETSFFNM